MNQKEINQDHYDLDKLHTREAEDAERRRNHEIPEEDEPFWVDGSDL